MKVRVLAEYLISQFLMTVDERVPKTCESTQTSGSPQCG